MPIHDALQLGKPTYAYTWILFGLALLLLLTLMVTRVLLLYGDLLTQKAQAYRQFHRIHSPAEIRNDYEQFQIGAPLPVRYDPAEPQKNLPQLPPYQQR